ncbi:putative DNA repair/recombination protein [Salmonella phage GEC_vB_N6]|nr:putative DNA repair/recombination protein [Salmonella phage GEC_vB_GOT]QPI15348.1 putative DNA repair/recombination protein [Salmonella phage GEC_vB_N6]
MSETKFETMKTEDIMAELDPLISVNPEDMNLDQISLKIGRSWMAVQRHYIREGRYLEFLTGKFRQIDLYLRRYYAGELPPNVYAERPLKVRPLKSDIDVWVKADDDYIELSSMLQEQKAKVKFIESCLDRLNKLGYEVKNAIDWRKYLDGM